VPLSAYLEVGLQLVHLFCKQVCPQLFADELDDLQRFGFNESRTVNRVAEHVKPREQWSTGADVGQYIPLSKTPPHGIPQTLQLGKCSVTILHSRRRLKRRPHDLMTMTDYLPDPCRPLAQQNNGLIRYGETRTPTPLLQHASAFAVVALLPSPSSPNINKRCLTMPSNGWCERDQRSDSLVCLYSDHDAFRLRLKLDFELC